MLLLLLRSLGDDTSTMSLAREWSSSSMADPNTLTVRLQALDGAWETCGADRLVGIYPEGFHGTANSWGSETCSFTLKRAPGSIYPDLSAFTPCEVAVAGGVVWEGRIIETPTRDSGEDVITVHGQGWQYHLDDDVLGPFYVHTQLGDYRDMRSFPNAVLGTTRLGAAFQVSNDSGTIQLALPYQASVVGGNYVGVVLDLGEGNTWKRAIIDYETSAHANFSLWLRGASTPDETSWFTNDAVSGVGLNTLGASGTTGGTITTASRYLHVFLYANSGSTLAADVWVKVKALRVFASIAYESGNQSILKADQVVKDVLSKGTVLFSSDQSEIKVGTFSIPEFVPGGAHSARELITAANAYENYEAKIEIGRRVIFRQRASAPQYEIGEWTGAAFEDASANSGEEIYNRVFVQGTGPDGEGLTVARTSTLAVADSTYRHDDITPQPTNPSFSVDTSGWTSTDGPLTRDTGVFDSSPASGRLDKPGGAFPEMWTQSWTQPFVQGFAYRVILRLRAGQASPNLTVQINRPSFGPTSGVTGAYYVKRVIANAELSTSEFRTFTLDFIPDAPDPYLSLFSEPSTGAVVYVDTIEIQRGVVNLVDRWGFRRTKILPISAALTQTSAARLGDLYLEAHRTTPFKGSFRVVGQGGVRRIIGGACVHPALLLRETGQLVRCSHRINPDTGDWGRDGAIDTVAYSHDELAADVSLDENRAGFEALLERLAVVIGQGTR